MYTSNQEEEEKYVPLLRMCKKLDDDLSRISVRPGKPSTSDLIDSTWRG